MKRKSNQQRTLEISQHFGTDPIQISTNHKRVGNNSRECEKHIGLNKKEEERQKGRNRLLKKNFLLRKER
jgi:hypothetical protein